MKLSRNRPPDRIDPDGRKIVFAHKRAMGDAVMFSAGVRDFALLFPGIRINVDSNQPYVFDHNPYLDRSLKKGDPGVEYYRVGYPAIGSCNNTNVHFTQMFLLDMIAVADAAQPLPISLGEFCATFANGTVGDPTLANPEKNPESREPFISWRNKHSQLCRRYSRLRGDIHLTDKERATNMIKEMYGVEKYWLISPGGKRDGTTKVWDWRRFQAVIDHFKGHIQFVSVGKSDLLVERLKGVIDLIDKFNDDPRPLFPLAYHAEGIVSGPSAFMHIAAALSGEGRYKPCVVIMGGREPTGWVHYSGHQILHTCGAFSCCADGGCWKARTHPLPKDPKSNRSLCEKPLRSDGKTVQACMDSITARDVIRAVEKYYDGDLYKYLKTKDKADTQDLAVYPAHQDAVIDDPLVWVDEDNRTSERLIDFTLSENNGTNKKIDKEINLLGNLNSAGGGEQSLCTIASLLQRAGWRVNLYPVGSVHANYRSNGLPIMDAPFDDGAMAERMTPGLPLLFYGNDTVRKFAEGARPVVEKSSGVMIGINYMNGPIPKCDWLAKSGKLRAVIFQNEEKMAEFDRDRIGFDSTRLIPLYGAIDLNRFLEVCPPAREKDESLVVLKHCVADYRKYVTRDSEGKGEKIHIWQQQLHKDNDIKLYTRLLKDVPGTRFEFMEAHKELAAAFKKEPRMVFHKWDSMPVEEFLARGHVYLYRTSNLWRDQYPRTVAEALAAGLPVLTEPRDGTRDRVMYGDTGFYCVDYDGFRYALKLLQRKEGYRQRMGRNAKDWARTNLDPRRWVEIVEEVFA
uniref:Putative glycosyltransferase n=1 Tax=viral metagenome TaxID=1070528 RepID=A0A6M3IS02_9ZZZZ